MVVRFGLRKSRLTFLSPPERCEYLPGRTRQLRHDIIRDLTPAEYLERLRTGWRRFGHTVFRSECPACDMCRALRVPVATFEPTVSQRRVWRRNDGAVRIEVAAPSVTPEKLALWDAFHRHGHETKGWPPDHGNELRPFVHNPFPTEEWCYYLADRLIAVSYVDALAEGLSAIYCYYDPDERHRSLGTFNVLAMIAAARDRRVPYVYLGYYVEGYRSLAYKANFRPNEMLTASGTWEPFRD